MPEAEGRLFDFSDQSAITPDVLETFPYEYPVERSGRAAVVEIDSDEFSAVCPFSGLPDFGTIRIRYVPGPVCVELKSLKYYLTSFRNVGIYQEHAANRILDDLISCCEPMWMEVVLDYRVRGGLHTVVTVAAGDRSAETPPLGR